MKKLSKKVLKEFGKMLAYQNEEAGLDRYTDIANGSMLFDESESNECIEHISADDEIGEEIDRYMAIELARVWAKRAGGKFIKK